MMGMRIDRLCGPIGGARRWHDPQRERTRNEVQNCKFQHPARAHLEHWLVDRNKRRNMLTCP
jgi:hypothetical protein